MIAMKKNKKKKFKRRKKISEKIIKKVPKISLKKKKINLKKRKSQIISKQKDQPKEQSLFQPLIKAYKKFREKRKIERLKQVSFVGKEREKQIEEEQIRLKEEEIMLQEKEARRTKQVRLEEKERAKQSTNENNGGIVIDDTDECENCQ